MRTADIGHHAYAVAASGYTLLPAQVAGAELAALRDACDRATAAVARHVAGGGRLAHTGTAPRYGSARCLYRWSDAAVRLLEHDGLHALAAAVLGRARLWDLSALVALPAQAEDAAVTTGWHRDRPPVPAGERPAYLWCFLCLDDVTAENGATWCVPGSHRPPARGEPALAASWSDDSLAAFPSRLQLVARAGDLVVLDPTMLHSSGRNRGAAPRRLLNVGLCRDGVPPLLDHRAIAGAELLAAAGPRARDLLDGGVAGLDASWDVLPEAAARPTR